LDCATISFNERFFFHNSLIKMHFILPWKTQWLVCRHISNPVKNNRFNPRQKIFSPIEAPFTE
jgi:hypothetical protein